MKRLAVLTIVVFFGISCGGGNGGPPPPPPPTGLNDLDADGIPDNRDRCPSQPETYNKVWDSDGCPDTPTDLYAQVHQDVNSYWHFQFQYPLPPYFSSNLYYYTGFIRTSCGPSQGGPFYCAFDYGVFLETQFMQDQLDRIGDFAPATIIAHEVGHHVQYLLGILQAGFFSIQIELQADCLAGAWAASAGARGLLEEGDFQEAANSLFSASDPAGTPWFSPGAHGTPAQRMQAFSNGFVFGPNACFG